MRYVIAVGAVVGIIVGMTALASYMHVRADFYVQSGEIIPVYERALFGLAAFWTRFGSSISVMLLLGAIVLAAVWPRSPGKPQA